MVAPLPQIDFQNLMGRDLALVGETISNDRSATARYVDGLVSYLEGFSDSGPAVEEELYLLGLRHHSSLPRQALAEINRQVQTRVKPPVSNFFLAGSSLESTDVVPIKSNTLDPPAYGRESVHRLNKIRKVISARPPSAWDPDLERFIAFHKEFAERTGDAGLFVQSLGTIAFFIISRQQTDEHAARAVERLVLEGLRWEPENWHLWGFWAQAYILVSDFTSAEYLFWEALRRHPENIVGRHMLTEFLFEHLRRIDDAISLGRDTLILFPENVIVRCSLAKHILAGGSPNGAFEAFDILTSSLDSLRNSHCRYQLAKALALLFDGVSTPERQSVVMRLPHDPRLVGGLGLLMARLPHGLKPARNFMRAMMSRFQSDTILRNLTAKVIASTMEANLLDEAIDILSTTIASDDNEYSRNQLVQCYLAKGDGVSRDKASALLDDIEKAFGVSKHTEVLRALLSSLDRRRLAKLMQVPCSREHSERQGTIIAQSGRQGALKAELPEFVKRWGGIRSLRFELEHGTLGRRQEAKRKIQDILKNDPTFAYAQILAERHQLWEAESREPTMFVTAFERALRTQSIEILLNLESTCPQWRLLSTAARTLLGDTNAAGLLRSLLKFESPGTAAAELVRKAVNPLVTNQPEKTIESFVAQRSRVLLALLDANESTVGEFRLAA